MGKKAKKDKRRIIFLFLFLLLFGLEGKTKMKKEYVLFFSF